MSVKRRSSTFASFFLANSRTVLASGIGLLRGSSTSGDRLESAVQSRAANLRDQAARLLQSVALSRTEESKGRHPAWQFDCSYSLDKVEFILCCEPSTGLSAG